ncbi:Molybdopterin synthase sulfur carrier subunit [Planctomycetes bacterium Pan216]|uniref:Molybdopterin synthase sulfur carrier subunit n=1 Tax=Kolteria novifilia TaxID=2527975 RepID=A0A518B519_9BACT|nr:Molybdopterin synthase sulfur carrier subunit [Planctomycetes bacterium Pan216]
MKIHLLLFAGAAEVAGTSDVTMEVGQAATIGELRGKIVDEFPDLGPIVGRSMFALNETYVSDDAAISDGDEVACIPPVSGG